jgi:serine/threonine protein kinase
MGTERSPGRKEAPKELKEAKALKAPEEPKRRVEPKERAEPRAPAEPKERAAKTLDDSVDGIVADYLDRLNSGQALDPDEILARHPRHGREIVRKLERFVALGSAVGSPPTLSILGDYRIRREIGRGGMGVVYEAWQSSMERRVALKVLPAGIAADEKSFHRFLREAKAAGRLHHTNIVSVYAMGVEQNTSYYAMLTGQSPRLLGPSGKGAQAV